MTIAGLPWYHLPETEEAQDMFWAGLARHLRRQGVRHLPGRLTRGVSVQALLADPRLVFGQCCGYDLVYGFSATLGYLATPRYSAPGCGIGTYSSLILVREDVGVDDISALRGRVAVINGFNSHSGTNALRSVVAPFSRKGRFFSQVKVSGGHVRSLDMLLDGQSDVMALDCVLHALLLRHRPGALVGTRILAQSAPVPAPPFVASAAMPDDTRKRIREGLLEALVDPALVDARSILLLDGAELLPAHEYLKIVELEAVALRRGYFELHATTPAMVG
jgi:ABC-type phosphate/phosphonate transport system substrate-binding protein